MASTYPRKYYSVAYSGLSTIPFAEGNVITTYDTEGLYYDVGNPAGSGENITRRKVSSVQYVSQLPDVVQTAPPIDTIFVIPKLNNGVPVTTKNQQGEDVPIYQGYCWDTTQLKFVEIFNNYYDAQVRSISTTGVKSYIVGTTEENTGVSQLVKRSDVYIANTGVIHASIDGNAATCNNADSANTATFATSAAYDNATTPNTITSYIHDVSSSTTSSGTSIVFSRANDTAPVTVNISDTTYGVYTAGTSGLVPGYNTTVSSDTTGLLLSGNGWIAPANITIPLAQNAIGDNVNSGSIAATYIKSATYNTTTQQLTLVHGDDTSPSPISIPNTTYAVFDSSNAGLVPAASGSGDANKFLKGDGTWSAAAVNNYTGASATDPGVAGLVPPAGASQQSYYLKGDGTWAYTFTTGVAGLVPGPALADSSLSLKADGTWAPCDDTKNTAGATQLDNTQAASPAYLIGAEAQNTNPQTYTDSTVYMQNHKLYSNGDEVVTLAASQALTNKTYEGMTLGTAAAADTASSVTTSTDVPTNTAVINYVSTAVPTLIASAIADKLDISTLAPVYSNQATYAVDDWCSNSVNGDQRLYRCKTAVTTAEDFDPTKWDSYTVIEAIKYVVQNS